MKTIAMSAMIVWFFASSVLCAAESLSHKEVARIAQEIGRFQLFQGTYTTVDLKWQQTSASHNAIFLLDTATGQVKRYVNRIDEDGRYVETWLPTNIVLQPEARKAVAPQGEGKTEK